MDSYDASRHPVPTALYRLELVQIEKNMYRYMAAGLFGRF